MKSQKNHLPRGFSSKAEKIAEDYRIKLNVHPCDHLCAFKLADYLGVSVCQPHDYELDATLLERVSGWSGLYLINEHGEKIIIHNTLHSPARQQSTVMHELAHLLCNHPLPDDIIIPTLPFLRRYILQHEQEAEYLGATLQITRKGLVWARRKGMAVAQIADYFKASEEMVKYRLQVSGVAKQFPR